MGENRMKRLEVEAVLEQLGIEPNAYLNWKMRREAEEQTRQQTHTWKALFGKSDLAGLSEQSC
jgi:hypothetical protein